MNNLCLHNIEDASVTQKDFGSFRTFTLYFKQKNSKGFQVEIFTDLDTELDLTVEKVPC
jgi:hypothetical protein